MMKVKPGILFVGVLAVTTALYACSASNPDRPSMSFVAPLAQQPANGVQYNYNQQPLTLSITNSVRTGSDPVTYSVEVATDAGFSNRVFTRDGIPEGSGGTTSVQIDVLKGGTTYYWRSTAAVGGVAGEAASAQSFFVKPNFVLNPPELLTPASGASVSLPRPTFTVVNSSFTGSPGTISYEFQVSTSASFNSLIASATVLQTPGQTSWTPNADLPEGNYYWRARARDLSNSVDSNFPSGASFERKTGLDLNSVTYLLGPNIASWPETRTISDAYHVGDQLCIFWDGEDWPAAPFPFDPSVEIEGNQWNFVQIGGKWYGAAGHWFRPGQNCKPEVDENYFIDGFQGIQPISSVVLHAGDVFAVAVSTPARTWPESRTLDHRSNVVFVVYLGPSRGGRPGVR